jgi:hypothetical protein
MFDCPEQNQTSPISRLDKLKVRVPLLIVIVTGDLLTGIAGNTKDQSPWALELVLLDSPVLIVTVTSISGKALPHTGNDASL